MIKCWTVWKAVAAARPRLSYAAPKVVTGIRRVRRARRAATAAVVLYPTIVCTVVGVGASPFLLYPRAGAEPGYAAASAPTPSWASDSDAVSASGRTVGSIPATGADHPIEVPEPESLLLLGTAALAMLVGIWRRPS